MIELYMRVEGICLIPFGKELRKWFLFFCFCFAEMVFNNVSYKVRLWEGEKTM